MRRALSHRGGQRRGLFTGVSSKAVKPRIGRADRETTPRLWLIQAAGKLRFGKHGKFVQKPSRLAASIAHPARQCRFCQLRRSAAALVGDVAVFKHSRRRDARVSQQKGIDAVVGGRLRSTRYATPRRQGQHVCRSHILSRDGLWRNRTIRGRNSGGGGTVLNLGAVLTQVRDLELRHLPSRSWMSWFWHNLRHG